MKSSSYKSIREFGKNRHHDETDLPIWTLFSQSLESKFFTGNFSQDNRPFSRPLMSYISQHCSENWDQLCEKYHLNHSSKSFYPNLGGFNSLELNRNHDFISMGDKMIEAAAERKYFKYPSCSFKSIPIDYHVAESLEITILASPLACIKEGGIRINFVSKDCPLIKFHVTESVFFGRYILSIMYSAWRRGHLRTDNSILLEHFNKYKALYDKITTGK